MESCVPAVPVAIGLSEKPTMALASRDVGVDPAELVATIAAARRGRLLRVHRRRLRWNPSDAIFSMANYLHASGAPGDYRQAIYAYNHAWWYVAEVLSWARIYTADYGSRPAMDERHIHRADT
jgi:hypothetical protein